MICASNNCCSKPLAFMSQSRMSSSFLLSSCMGSGKKRKESSKETSRMFYVGVKAVPKRSSRCNPKLLWTSSFGTSNATCPSSSIQGCVCRMNHRGFDRVIGKRRKQIVIIPFEHLQNERFQRRTSCATTCSWLTIL